jgi:oxygen-independent coproporphyrinogen-3 oxidase
LSGIYFHIPFCRQACAYCDFHFSTSLSSKSAVIAAIQREIETRHHYLEDTQVNSIYFGGGSPSILEPGELELLLLHLSQYFTWSRDCEVTLEANPDDISMPLLKAWKNIGINRLSIGLQSFNDAELRWMNRAHTALESVNAVKKAQDAGFDNLTIDLIYGSKFQTLESWGKTLQQAVSLDTPHISSYNLTIEKKTALGISHARGLEPAINDELSSAQFLMMRDILTANGYIQYEVSNFGRKGRFARHNSNYWLGRHYLGLGPSAHSYNGVSRQWNISNNNLYVKRMKEATNYFEIEMLTTENRYNEYVLTRLRTLWGCSAEEMSLLFGEKIASHFKNRVALHDGYFEVREGHFILNPAGLLKADGIASDLFL